MKLSKRHTFIKFALAYKDNIGFEEMMKFYQTATPELTSYMDFLLEHNLTNDVIELLQIATNVKLEPF